MARSLDESPTTGVEPAPDPVDLVRGEPLRGALFLCSSCHLLQSTESPLPTGGVLCVACNGQISTSDRIEFAGLGARLLALVIDVSGLLLLYTVTLVAVLPFVRFVPLDEERNPTDEFIFWSLFTAAVLTAVYLAYGDVVGTTLGKKFAGIRIVRRATVRPPGLFFGALRAVAKTLTLATAGLGYLTISKDPEARAPHDVLAGTRVIYRA